jgi:hypothetical protein
MRHKIAESIETIAMLIMECGGRPDIATLGDANSACAYLFNLFCCSNCQGSGRVLNIENEENPLVECQRCEGTGVNLDILDRLEAEEITK